MTKQLIPSLCVGIFMLKAVCSGGQCGADIAGVRAAKEYGIKTFGVMPKGFKTKHGNRPEYAKEFGMTEHKSPLYPPRTRANVEAADGTIRFAYDFDSPGERATLRSILELDKPYLDVDLNQSWKPSMIAQWIKRNNIKVLNVAGNANPVIEERVEKLLIKVFKKL